LGADVTDIALPEALENATPTRDELVAEVAAMHRLHQLGLRLLNKTGLQPLLDEALAAIMDIQSAHLGCVQLYNPATHALEMVAQFGFQPAFLDYFHVCDEETTICGRALLRGERVIVEDILDDEGFAPHLDVALSAGYRAVQSTPLFSRAGDPLGMISTYFRQPHRPSERELRLTDLYARQAEELIERERAEGSQRGARERMQLILDSIADNFFAFSKDWRYTYLNKHAEEQIRQLGMDPAALIGKTLWEVFPHVPNEAAIRRAMTERTVVTDEVFYPPLGEWVENHVYPSPDGGIVFFQKYITERKRTEEALRASEERFRRYFDLGLIGMAITSPSKGCIEVNDELCRLLGYERGELLRKSWAELTHPDDFAADAAQFDRVMAGEMDGYTIDKRWIRKDGRVIDSIMSAHCVRRADGSVDYFVGLVLDTTERKRAEENLRESEERFRSAVEAIPHQVWSFRADGSLGYWNQRVIDYTGLTAEDLRQGGWGALHPEEAERVKEAWRKAQQHGTQFEMEQRIRGRDGRFRRFVCRAVPIKDEQGRPIEWYGTSTDVEERRQAEEALHKAQAELSHITRVTTMGEFATSIAHEVNQPLAAIVANGSACARWLAADPPNLHEAGVAIQRTIRDAIRASDVIAGIRAFLKREDSRAPLNINEVIGEVVDLMVGKMESHGVSLEGQPGDELPPVMGNRVQLQQVALNLAMNALEAMDSTSEHPRVLGIRTEAGEDGMVLVSIRDSGVGLDPAYRERAFDAFHTTKPQGLGMGLPISRSIVEAHGGRLWATANPDRGETFRFTLPVVAPTPP
jgi:PAS domain S-box-containing protein